jgi:hypothetical protein
LVAACLRKSTCAHHLNRQFLVANNVAGRCIAAVDMTYFSLVTLRPTVTATSCRPRARRMLAMIQAVTGQFYVAVVVAIFVGCTSQRRR